MKKVLLCPGFKDNYTDRDYATLVAAIKSKGYDVVFVPIKWRRTAIYDWVEQLQEEYAKYDPAETILAGFSYGSMTSFVTASARNPSELWLFSFSPYFAEDMPHIKKWWRNSIGLRRAQAFETLSFNDLVKAVKCPTKIWVGQKEIDHYPLLPARCKAAQKSIRESKLLIVPNAGHDVTNPDYLNAIKENI